MKKIVLLFLAIFCLVVASEAKTTVTTTTLKATKNKPDLVVSDLKVIPAKIQPNKVIVVYQLKNIGVSNNQKTNVQLQLLDEQGNVIDTRTVNQIDLGAPKGSATFSVRDKKRYTIKATADYNNFIRETDETNNSRNLSFGVGIKL